MKGKGYYNNLIKDLRKNIINAWYEKAGKKNSLKRIDYENEVHDKIKELVVSKYVGNLNRIHTDVTCN